MKLKTLTLIGLFIHSFLNAQTLTETIRKTDNEQFVEAAEAFNKLILSEPNNASFYFYAGENYFQKGVPDSALIFWNKTMTVDPESPFSFIGVGKSLCLKGDIAGAKTKFALVEAMTKKGKYKKYKAEVLKCVAKAYISFDSKDLDEAIRLLNLAIKASPNDIDCHLLKGDALYLKTPENSSNAIKSYNLVLTINQKSSRGIVRKAKIYQLAKNYKAADSLYNIAKNIDSTYAPAYRENAELNMAFGQSKKAIENWKKYLILNNSFDSRYRYAVALFKGKQYCDAIQELLSIKPIFTDYYIDRMLTYSYFECDKDSDGIEKGLASSELFFSKCPADKIEFYDYKYRGKLYLKGGQDSLAILDFEKASSMDKESELELTGEIVKLYFKLKKYSNAIQKYETKLQQGDLTAAEYFDLGRAYYLEGKNYVAADSAFSMVIMRSPNYASAFIYKARVQNKKVSSEENTTAIAMHYKAALERISTEERRGRSIKIAIEAAKFLGAYYRDSKEKDPVKAKEYWVIVNELDPEDKQAKAFLGIK